MDDLFERFVLTVFIVSLVVLIVLTFGILLNIAFG